jgi:hypothetical protein
MRYALCMTLVLVAVMVVWAPMVSADGRSFRTVGSQRYEILEARDLVIYSTDVIVRKGALEKAYFFSVGLKGEIVPLTILNLKNAFPTNHAFHDSLDMMFKNDSQLTKYDDFHNMYKVNRLLAASKES